MICQQIAWKWSKESILVLTAENDIESCNLDSLYNPCSIRSLLSQLSIKDVYKLLIEHLIITTYRVSSTY